MLLEIIEFTNRKGKTNKPRDYILCRKIASSPDHLPTYSKNKNETQTISKNENVENSKTWVLKNYETIFIICIQKVFKSD